MCCLYPDGNVVTVVDVLHITHAAIATVSEKFQLLDIFLCVLVHTVLHNTHFVSMHCKMLRKCITMWNLSLLHVFCFHSIKMD